jgi:hypothetical protein
LLRGDISNKQAPIIAFNVNNLLFEDYKDMNPILRAIKFKLSSETKLFFGRKINKVIVNTINRLWGKYDYSIYLITMHPEYKQEYYNILDENEVNYTSLVSFDNWDELREISLLQYTYYFDDNEELISFVGAKASHIKELQNILK